MKRRSLLKGMALGAVAWQLNGLAFAKAANPVAGSPDAIAQQLAALERMYGGRLGVAMLNTQTGQHAGHRGDQRFLLCSTFKLLAVAAVLAQVDEGRERLDRRITYGKDVLLKWAPVTAQHVGAHGMTVGELCEAALTVSDNTAANLLLTRLGGPSAVTGFVRHLGDPLTRLDRIEPALNVSTPGDLRDTTTPDAMLGDLRELLLGDALSAASRRRLSGWLRACTTGKDKLRAGLPSGWQAGDKTGSGAQGESNDVAIIWPPQRSPVLVAAYYAPSSPDPALGHRVLSEVGRLATMI